MNLNYKRLNVFDKGIKTVKPVSYIPLNPSKRGKIISFSNHSVNRLRTFLLEKTIDNSVIYGLTLTCPFGFSSFEDRTGLGLESYHLLEYYRASFNRFTGFLRWHYSDCGFVFRHELQKRKVPHCHIVCFLKSDIKVDVSDFLYYWLKALKNKADDLVSAYKYSVKLDRLDDNALCMFRYLADHTSKGKQDQLGYQGKQWGVIGSKNFKKSQSTSFEFSNDRQAINFHRQISRLVRYTKSADCVFGSKKLSRYKMRSVVFVNRKTVEQIYQLFHVEHSESICIARKMFLAKKISKKIKIPPCIVNQYMI